MIERHEGEKFTMTVEQMRSEMKISLKKSFALLIIMIIGYFVTEHTKVSLFSQSICLIGFIFYLYDYFRLNSLRKSLLLMNKNFVEKDNEHEN